MYKGYIYKITNLVNGMVYIGATKYIKTRFRQHVNNAKKNNKGKLYDAIREFGEENFKFEELLCIERENLELLKESLSELEILNINFHNSLNKGYNMIIGKLGSLNIDKSTLSTHSEETRKRMSENLKGSKRTEEQCKRSGDSKKQRVICLNDNKIFEGILDCVNFYKIPSKIQSKVCKGLEDYKGLKFRYIDKNNNILPIQDLPKKRYIKCSNGKIYFNIPSASRDVGTNTRAIHAVLSKITNSSMKKTFQWVYEDEAEDLLSNGYSWFI